MLISISPLQIAAVVVLAIISTIVYRRYNMRRRLRAQFGILNANSRLPRPSDALPPYYPVPPPYDSPIDSGDRQDMYPASATAASFQSE
jgi:hypothetical protein